MPSLILITEDYPRQVFQLGKATIMVGRDDTSEIYISNDTISKNHATIVFDGKSFVVRDNGSTNGTYVNGQPTKYHILSHHDVLRFGSCLFLVDMKDDNKDTTSVTHTGSKEGKVVEISPKSLVQGASVVPIKVVLSPATIHKKTKTSQPFTAR